MIRASIGLAYPPCQPIGSNAQILEELPSDHTMETESGISHLDFNTRNIMMTVGDELEHGIGVKAKLIDFGLAKQLSQSGSPRNIFDAAQVSKFLLPSFSRPP